MMYDSYEPRFIAPRYYDTQFIMYKQPIYTRTYGNNMNLMNHKKRKQKYRKYIYESSSSSSDDI